jgi:hypothetical protein
MSPAELNFRLGLFNFYLNAQPSCLTKDEARRIAANIVKLPELLRFATLSRSPAGTRLSQR